MVICMEMLMGSFLGYIYIYNGLRCSYCEYGDVRRLVMGFPSKFPRDLGFGRVSSEHY